MKDFAALFTALDQTTSTKAKTDALAAYLSAAPDPDRLWCVALLSGRRPKRTVPTPKLRAWAAEAADIPPWLFEESYAVVGDLAETIALLLPPATRPNCRSLSGWITELRRLAPLEEAAKRAAICAIWDQIDGVERFVFNKLTTGGFRVGVSQKLMTRALAQATGQPEAELAHRLMGQWHPDRDTWQSLIAAPNPRADLSRPYPFQLALGLEGAPQSLGPAEEWLAEWKWDGIRGQIIKRGGALYIWSRGEELITDRFPDLAPLVDLIPEGSVLDGEILAWNIDQDRPLAFAQLQRRIGRKSVPKSLIKEAPVIFQAYDLIEKNGEDIRHLPLQDRRAALGELARDQGPLRLSPDLTPDWTARETLRASARDLGAEGLMLKRRASPYSGGRKKGDWWKWKLDPLTIDAVLIYAQAGHGRRATLYTDYTFAVWQGDTLVPFTKAYSGLNDAEFREITAWVRKNTQERFGPVRRVTPDLVFEIAFEGIQRSARHKSGVALRFPRMLRWRRDKPAKEANSHQDLLDMLRLYG